jgi:predicted small lipoprotein YifL
MGNKQKILVTHKGLRAVVAYALCACAVLTACGQKGALYMPNDPEFQQRATLPEIVRRQLPGSTATPPANTASAPAAQKPASAASAATGR